MRWLFVKRRAKLLPLAALALATALLTACGGGKGQSSHTAATPTPFPLTTAAPTATPAPEPIAEPETPLLTPAPAEDAAASADSGDALDLTTMSATMIYAQVSDMVMNPETYVDRRITMQGQFTVYEGNPANTDGAEYYFTVTIADATACCQQGIEYIIPGAEFPDGYPTENATITVSGIWQPYTEGDITYYHLVADSVTED